MYKLQMLFLLIVIAGGLASSSGCSLLGDGKSGSDASLLASEAQGTFTVMLKGSKPATVPLTEGMTIQNVVDSTKARRKFGKMEIVIKRMVPGKQMRHNLKVDFDMKKNRIPYDQDYTIYPNDIVMISADKTTSIDKVVDALSGVLGTRPGR